MPSGSILVPLSGILVDSGVIRDVFGAFLGAWVRFFLESPSGILLGFSKDSLRFLSGFSRIL